MKHRQDTGESSRMFSERLDQAIIFGLAAITALALLSASAQASVGVSAASRDSGAPGAEVKLTLECGFCFPPCKGPKGERHPAGFERGPCMLGTHGAKPPSSFGISLMPIDDVQPHHCGPPDGVCPPQASAPPQRAPFRYLGQAIPPPGGNNPEHGDAPRYLLDFMIPNLAPGLYAYVLFCDACLKGKRGSLVASTGERLWRLRVTAPRPSAEISLLGQAWWSRRGPILL
jgi:hypothetical protein